MSSRRKTHRGWPGRDPGHSLSVAGRVANAYFRVSLNPDAGEQKSISQQRAERDEWLPRAGVVAGGDYADDDRAASRFAGDGSQREEFTRLRADITAGRLDGHVLWFWSSSRQTRGDIALDTLAEESAAHGIVWCTGGQVLNPANDDDMMIAGINNIIDKAFSARLSKDVTRAKKAGALAGRPNAVPLYGYRREYETDAAGQPVLVKGRPVILGDVPRDLDEAGAAVPGTPAAVVREIFGRIEAGETLSAIRASLEDRRIPAPRYKRKCTSCGHKLGKDRACPHGHVQDLCQWHVSAVRFIAMNVGYLARRLYDVPDGLTLRERRRHVLEGVETLWPPLVSEDQFWRVQAILDDAHRVRWAGPGRGNPLPGPGETRSRHTWLMVPAARCAGCGAALGGHREGDRDWYKCRTRGCVSVRADWLDAWAEDRLVSWLVLPEARQIFSGDGDDAEILAALKDLHEDLAEAKRMVKLPRGAPGRISLGSFAEIEASLEAQIEELEAKRRPPTLAALNMRPLEVADWWHELRAGSPDAARQFMAEVATVYVHPAASRGGGVTRGFDENRVEWRWKIGPAAVAGPTREGCTQALAARKAALEAARARAGELLRADPSRADAAIGREAGCAYGTVARIRRQLTEAGEITDPGYRAGRNGKLYRSAGNGTPGSPRKSVAEGPVTRRPDHVIAKRARIAAALAEHPDWSHARTGRELGVAHGTVASVCAEAGGRCGHGRDGQGSRADLAGRHLPGAR